MEIQEAKQKVAEKKYMQSWQALVENFTTEALLQSADEAWQMVLEELQFDYNNLKADYKHSLTCHNKLVVQMEDRINYLKAENERLRKDSHSKWIEEFKESMSKQPLILNTNPLYDLSQLENAFMFALSNADIHKGTDIDFDKAWNNYKKHILKIK